MIFDFPQFNQSISMLQAFHVQIQKYIEYRIIFQMFSPISSHKQSPFTSLNTSVAHISSYTHSRNNSNAKSISSAQTADMLRIPSQKKLTLTHQQVPVRTHRHVKSGENQQKMRVPTQENPNERFVPLGSCRRAEEKMVSHQSLMLYFQQSMENLKKEYLLSLREYEAKIDELQQQLQHNSKELQYKNSLISKLEASLREIRQRQKQKEEQIESQLFKRIEDIQKRVSMLTNFAEASSLQVQDNTDNLTHRVISHFGARLATLRDQQTQFLHNAINKIISLQKRVEAREKQEQSIGTRGSIQSVEQPAAKTQDQGISFWDDCFFYPGEHSQNCNLIAEMSSRRSEPLKCWVDHEGFLRYYDSRSFLFNRKGEKMTLALNELDWLHQQGMIRIY